MDIQLTISESRLLIKLLKDHQNKEERTLDQHKQYNELTSKLYLR